MAEEHHKTINNHKTLICKFKNKVQFVGGSFVFGSEM